MPKIVITDQLAATLKLIRQKNSIPAKELASHIKKSQSYISKFEKGQIKTIDKNILDRIIGFIIRDKDDFAEKIDEILSSAIYRFTNDELDEQIWFMNYSTVFCKIPLPEELVLDINQQMKFNNIPVENLCKRINANEFIPQSFNASKTLPRNEWFIRQDNKRLAILMDIPLDKLNDILSNSTKSTRYVYLQAIVQYLFKIISFGNVVEIPDDEERKIEQKTADYLNSFNFYSLAERQKRMSEAQKSSDNLNSLCSQDQTYLSLIRKICDLIQVYSGADVYTVNAMLTTFITNLQWDAGFMLYLMSLDFHDLNDATFAYKKEFMDSIKSQVNDAIQDPKKSTQMEHY